MQASFSLVLALLVATAASLSVDAPSHQYLQAGRDGFIMCAPRPQSAGEKPMVRWLDANFAEITNGRHYRITDGGLIVRNVRRNEPLFVVCEVSMREQRYLRHFFIDITVQ